jgi:hypothetical protein
MKQIVPTPLSELIETVGKQYLETFKQNKKNR